MGIIVKPFFAVCFKVQTHDAKSQKLEITPCDRSPTTSQKVETSNTFGIARKEAQF